MGYKKTSDQDRRRSKRGHSLIEDNRRHPNLLSELKEILPSEVSTDSDSLAVELDLEALISRGLELNSGSDGPQSGLYNKIGINHDRCWDAWEKNSEVRGRYVLCPREYVPYLRAAFAGHSVHGQHMIWRSLFFGYGHFRHVLIEVRSSLYKKVWLGILASGDASIGVDKLLTLICADVGNGMSYDFQKSGIGEFDLCFVSGFSKIEEALLYRETLVNLRMDEGWGSYNIREIESGMLKRFVRVEVEDKLVEKLLAACLHKKIRIKSLVAALVRGWLKKVE